jgi:hypothetical protein
MQTVDLYGSLVQGKTALKHTKQKETTKRTGIVAKTVRWKYPTREINNKNNGVPKGTEDKV